MEHNTLQGVIFDLDGTLLDSGSMWRQVDKKIMDYYGKEMPDDLSETVQRMSIEEFSRYFVEQFHLPVTPEQFAQQVADTVAQEYRELLPLKPHVMGTAGLAGQPADRLWRCHGDLRRIGRGGTETASCMGTAGFLLTEQEAGAPKTQPRIFQLAAQKLHLGRRQIAVAEDSLHALQCARAAGFFTVGVYDAANPAAWQQICATATVHVHDILEMKQFF